MIERASDDEESDEDYAGTGKRRRKKVLLDEDVADSDIEEEEDQEEEEMALDELENESVSLGSKRKQKAAYKRAIKNRRNKADDADLGEDND